MWSLVSTALAAPVYCPFGVNAHQASDEALDAAAAAGLGWVRFDFNWLQFEPEQDVFDWTIPDRFIDHAASLGLNVYVTIGYTPAWAAGSSCDDASANADDHCLTRIPANVADWEDFVRQSVLRYGDRVKYWGIWNEPNLSQFFAGTRDEWINSILIPAADVVHAECSDCFVVGPELANLREAHWDANEGTCVFGECIFNGWNYSLDRILDDAGGYFDIISHHKYSDPADGWWDSALNGDFLIVQYIEGIREITERHADGKPVWLTEFGWETTPTGSYDPTYAADQLSDLYALLPDVQAGTASFSPGSWPELQALFWYDLHDDPGGYSWGLLDASLVPKPTYDAYTQVITDLGGCEAFAPSTTTIPTTETLTTGDTATSDTAETTTDTTDGTETPPNTDTTDVVTTSIDTGVPDELPSDTGELTLPKPSEGCACQSYAVGSSLALWPLLSLMLVRRTERWRVGRTDHTLRRG